ncbi:MAG TPA: hypothetical protein VHG32_27040 [Thermoanaerobaculia bacterium]|jgi:hypothetical protein|nr:hypothetical protein [Thermoanaerobaculia bacterium]
MRNLVRLGAVLSFLFCLAGGLFILIHADYADARREPMTVAIGLYFLGKACFVGPMLLGAAERLGGGGPRR